MEKARESFLCAGDEAYSVEGICQRSVGEDIFEGVEVGGAERTIMNKCGLRGQPCRMPRWRDDNEVS